MKICPNCKAEVEDNFELCWNCNYSFTENTIVYFKEDSKNNKELDCLRCKSRMVYTGEYKFHEGPIPIFELLQNRETYDLFACPQCGKVEFFIPMR